MKREKYKILIIHQFKQDLILAIERLNQDFPEAVIYSAQNWQELESIISLDIIDIAILYCNITWEKPEKIIAYLNSQGHYTPIFAFIERSKLDEVRHLLDLGVQDYSLSDAKFSFRLPIAIRSIIEHSRTSQKTQEIKKKLAKQEIMFKTLFENAPEAIALTSEEGIVFEINPMFTDIFGYTQAELIGKSIDEAICAADVREEGKQINRDLATKQTVKKHLVRLHKDGHPINVSLVSTRLKFQDGSFGLYAIYRDIDYEIKTRSELQKTKLYLNSLLESIDEMIISLDIAGNVVYFNSSYQKHLLEEYGFQIEIGMNLFENKNVEKLESHRDFIESAFTGKANTKNIEIVHQGQKIYRELSSSPIIFQDKLVGISIISRDITRFINFQNQLKLETEKAESANIAKSQFLATMSHEIRTPLNGILGMTDLLNDTCLNEEQVDYVNSIKISGDTLLEVINDVLDFSKLESTNFSLIKSNFSMVELFAQLETIVISRAKEKGIYLKFEYDNQAANYFYGDKIRIKQILLNIIYNAIKFTDNGGVVVSFRKKEDSHIYCFAVKDTGIGIKKSDLKNLFDPFTQTNSSITNQSGGTGLGLAIVKRLVDAMGGNIHVESEFNVGSTFKIELHLPPSSSSNIKKIKKTTEHNFKINQHFAKEFPLRILVAEDNFINQKLIMKILDKLGYQAKLANNGKEAFEQTLAHQYEVILMDVEMPVMTGVEAMKLIRGREDLQQLYIVAVTANAKTEDETKYLAAGMDNYLSKPINIQRLTEVLAQAFKYINN